jgi:hypothetical protein
MSPMTSRERVARFRYAKSLETTLAKLQRLITEVPSDFSYPPDVELCLIDVLGSVVGVEAEFVETEKHFGFQFMLEKSEELEGIGENTVLRLSPEASEYYEWRENEASKAATVKAHENMTRNAFCEQVLGARLANPRWGWVGVKEPTDTEEGELYIFGWEHNRNRDGENTLGLFSKEVSLDDNGRRRPGHRDALEKIERAQSGELKPYIVWQSAVEPKASSKTIENLNGEFVTACDLYIDQKGYWTANLLEKKFLV